MKAYVMIGISGSGKSRFVNKNAINDCIIVNNDSVRRRLTGISKKDNLWDHYKFDRNIESQVKSEMNELINYAYRNNKDIWIDNTNLFLEKNKKLENHLKYLGFEVIFLNQNTNLNINAYRYDNRNRVDQVSDSVINDQYINASINNYIVPDKEQRYQNTIAIVDIDGTVADHGTERSPFEYHKVMNDKPRWYVIETLDALYTSGSISFIQFLSGRESICYEDTIKWLQDKAGFDMSRHRLLMRKRGDHRKDVIIKSEIYENCIKDKYEVKFVFDDRNQVVDYWWDQNLPVFHVGDYRNVF